MMLKPSVCRFRQPHTRLADRCCCIGVPAEAAEADPLGDLSELADMEDWEHSPQSSCNTADLMAVDCIPDTLIDPLQQPFQEPAAPCSPPHTSQGPCAQPPAVYASDPRAALPANPQNQQHSSAPAQQAGRGWKPSQPAGTAGRQLPAHGFQAASKQPGPAPASSSLRQAAQQGASKLRASACTAAFLGSGARRLGKENVSPNIQIDLADDDDADLGLFLPPKATAGPSKPQGSSFVGGGGSQGGGLATGTFLVEVRAGAK